MFYPLRSLYAGRVEVTGVAVEEETMTVLLVWYFCISFVGCREDLRRLFLGFPHRNCEIPQRDLGNCKVNPHPEAGFMVGI